MPESKTNAKVILQLKLFAAVVSRKLASNQFHHQFEALMKDQIGFPWTDLSVFDAVEQGISRVHTNNRAC